MTTPAVDGGSVAASALARWSVFGLLLLGFILVPFVALEGRMDAIVQQTLQSTRSAALITLAVVAFLLLDIVLPVPSSFVLVTTGFLLGTAMGAAAGFVGLSCASLGGYCIGRYAGGPLAQRVVGRAQLERFERLSQRYGDGLLVAFRAMPVLAEATTILAGMSRMPLPRFLFVVSIGNAVVALLYAWIGAVSASRSSFLIATAASVVVPVLVVLAVRRASQVRPV